MRTIELDRKLTGYLLGQLSEDERIEIEDRYLSDGESFDELLVAEDELIDEYVRGELSARNRELFEQNFLSSPARKERVKSARALMKFADRHAAASRVSWLERFRSFRLSSPVTGLILATGLLVLIVGGPLVAIQINKLRSGLTELQSQQLAQVQREKGLEQLLEQQKQQNEALSKSLDRERGERGQLEQEIARLREQQQAQPASITFGLGFGERSKGGTPEATVLEIRRGVDVIKLRLDLFKDEYENYLVVLEDSQQHDIWRGLLQSTRIERNSAVVVRLPSRLFNPGRYKLTLSGTNNKRDYVVISEFPVDVIKK